jgi:Rrf2 family protein
MMISTKGRYAMRVLIDLAEYGGERYVPLKDLAGRQGISVKYLENIISVLSKADMLEGIRGKGGGYKLCRPPEQYTVGSILKLTEGTLAPVSCLENVNACERAGDCKTLPMWQKLDGMIDQFFESITLKDLMQEE